MQIADARIFDHRHGLFVGGFGFGWESGNNIRTKCHIRAAAARLVTKSYDIAAQMASFHPPQNQIIAMLRRDARGLVAALTAKPLIPLLGAAVFVSLLASAFLSHRPAVTLLKVGDLAALFILLWLAMAIVSRGPTDSRSDIRPGPMSPIRGGACSGGRRHVSQTGARARADVWRSIRQRAYRSPVSRIV